MADDVVNALPLAHLCFGSRGCTPIWVPDVSDCLDCPLNHCHQSRIPCRTGVCSTGLKAELVELLDHATAFATKIETLDKRLQSMKDWHVIDYDELNNTAIKVSIDVTSLCRNECFLSEDFEVDDLECLACAVQVARIAHCAWREGLKQYRASVDALRDNIKISPTDAGDAGYTHTPGRTSTAYRPQRTLTLALRPSASPPPAWDEGSTPPQPPTPSEKNPILDHDYQYRQYGDNDWLPDDDKVSHPAERPGYPPPVSTLEWEKAAIRQMVADGSQNPYTRYGSYRGHGAGTLKVKDRGGMNFNGGMQGGRTNGGDGKTGKKAKRPQLEGYRKGR